ncbi:hypothetical protein X737_06310 [Mesorhizobium sp. L48C026A00]|nr:hypothetical protein X737_06310 [Mesorhizobium sp. L48C026A00]
MICDANLRGPVDQFRALAVLGILGIELSVGSSYKAARSGHVPAAGA